MRYQRIAIFAFLLVLACSQQHPLNPAIENADTQTSKVPARHGFRSISVMTQNVYLGADLNPILNATNPSDVPFLVAQAWAAIQGTDFGERADALAVLIEQANPQAIGLQEVALYRMQTPGDAVVGGQTPATTVVLDFLDVLLNALDARGLTYTAAVSQDEFDVEVPMFVGVTGSGQPLFDDLRLTDRDVILVRDDIEFVDPRSERYNSFLPVPFGTTTIPLYRGWTSVQLHVADRAVRFVNTHLEVQNFASFQMSQANELLTMLDDEPLPVLLVGDLNSAANVVQTPTYGHMIDNGFVDVWAESRNVDDGLTCCQDKELLNANSQHDQRLDLVLARGFFTREDRIVGSIQAEVVGEEQADRTPSGLWPADHAGVAATLHVPDPDVVAW